MSATKVQTAPETESVGYPAFFAIHPYGMQTKGLFMDKLNILLVDDHPAKLLSYEAVLSDLGEKLLKAHSGEGALDCLLKNEIAVVLLGMNMPGLDGFQLADMIREHPRYKDTAIIFISGTQLTDLERLAAYQHGAVDYVSLPIIPPLLRAKVKVFTDLYRKTRALEHLSNELRQLSGHMIAAQDQERRRIARELHDSLGQQLTLAKITADGIASPEQWENVRDISAALEEAIRQVRSISHLLHPPLLDEVGLESALAWYLDGLNRRSGKETSLDLEPPDFPRLPGPLENTLYRIVQEAVTNAYRHSGGSKIAVSLKCEDTRIVLAVRDNGRGISNETAAFKLGAFGVGIGGMRQRVAEIGGDLTISNANPGTLVRVVIPTVCAKPG